MQIVRTLHGQRHDPSIRPKTEGWLREDPASPAIKRSRSISKAPATQVQSGSGARRSGSLICLFEKGIVRIRKSVVEQRIL